MHFGKNSYAKSFSLCLVFDNVGEKWKENGLGKK